MQFGNGYHFLWRRHDNMPRPVHWQKDKYKLWANYFMGCMPVANWRTQNLKRPWWRQQMETFSALLAICAANSPIPGEIPRTKASDAELLRFSLICVWINGWVNNREAGDLRRYRAHYDATVMHVHLFATSCCVQRANYSAVTKLHWWSRWSLGVDTGK